MLKYGAFTDIGLVRTVNQDNYAVSARFAVVADGMGGHSCGEIASKLAVDTISDFLNSKNTIGFKELKKAIEKANTCIYKEAQKDASMSGMGTTAVVCAFDDRSAYIANIGDSRCYKISGGDIVQITKDHSLVQKLLDNGEISPEEALVRKDKNVLYRAVGCDEKIKTDCFEVDIKSGDIFLLCSDGLTNCVNNDDILNTVTENEDLQTASEKLVRLANNNGGYDNITVLIIKIK